MSQRLPTSAVEDDPVAMAALDLVMRLLAAAATNPSVLVVPLADHRPQLKLVYSAERGGVARLNE